MQSSENLGVFWEEKWKYFNFKQKKQVEKLYMELYGPFLWMGFNCLEVTEPLQQNSLLFAI